MVLDGSVIGSGGVVKTEIQIAVVNGLLYLKTSSNFEHVLNGKVEEKVEVFDRFLGPEVDPNFIPKGVYSPQQFIVVVVIHRIYHEGSDLQRTLPLQKLNEGVDVEGEPIQRWILLIKT